MTRLAIIALVALTAVAVAACGESSADKAKNTVCSARDDMSKQVDTLKGMTAATFSTETVSKSLSAMKDDLSDIKGAQSELSSERRDQVQSANQAFTSTVRGVLSDLGSGTSADQLQAAVQQLASSYQQTFAKVDCSST